ncbi:MAG: PQQ-binding-like beta-propeller repeat protein [Candidatus Bathyarchaeia archaeon]|jgi:hypothetical protein
MKFAKNKNNVIAISIFLMLSMVASMLLLPTASAHTPPWTVPTWAYIYAAPNPIGVNQSTALVYWLNAVPPTATGVYGDRWTGIMINIIKPDGTNDTIGPLTSDPIGGGYSTYTPKEAGNYTLQVIFPGNKITGLPTASGVPMDVPAVNDTYTASMSDPYTLTVQQEPIQLYPETPLPTNYWTLPINGLNRNWYQIDGNWLNAGDTGPGAPGTGPTTLYNPYSTGPESAHIMWARDYWAGGIASGQTGSNTYYNGESYELYWNTPIIIDGKLYYNVETPPRYGWYAVDLYTGQTDYFQNTTGPIDYSTGYPAPNTSGSIDQGVLSFGQVYNYESPNQEGAFPYLWSTNAATPNTWKMFDAYTGNYICSIANVPAGPSMFGFSMPWGTTVYGKDGSLLKYNIVSLGSYTNPHYYLQCWNTSQVLSWNPAFNSPNYNPSDFFSSFYYWEWRPFLNYTFDGNHGYSLNVTVPAVQGTILAVREDQYVIGGTTGSNDERGVVQGNLWALSLAPGEEGHLLWNITFTPPHTVVPSTAGTGITMNTVDPEDGVFTFAETVTRTRWVYSLKDGSQLWQSKPEPEGAYYGMTEDIYDGMLLAGGMAAGFGNALGYSGHIIAYNITTGKILWDYASGNPYGDAAYDNVPIDIACIADGKIYTISTEHSPTEPLWRDSYIRCINASNGVELWRISHYGTNPVIADGYLVDLNNYDDRIYCYGKGPSATTVEAPLTAITGGTGVEIQGTVTDISAGSQENAVKANFLDGLPCVSDASETQFMEAVYMQQPMPTNATGVPVSIDAIDPNGNIIHIGNTTSDIDGNYGYAWATPNIPGQYTITAMFEGSHSYYPSSSETHLVVSAAPAATHAPTATPTSVADMYFVPAIAGLFVLIIIVAIVIVLLMLRKRP